MIQILSTLHKKIAVFNRNSIFFSLYLNLILFLGDTALHFAVKQKNARVIKALIDKNANFNVKNKNGKSSLDVADEDLKNFINELLNKKKVY